MHLHWEICILHSFSVYCICTIIMIGAKKNSLEILHWKCVFTFTRTYTQKKIGETLKDHNRSFFFSVWNAMVNNVVQHAIGFLCIHSNTDIHCLILFFFVVVDSSLDLTCMHFGVFHAQLVVFFRKIYTLNPICRCFVYGLWFSTFCCGNSCITLGMIITVTHEKPMTLTSINSKILSFLVPSISISNFFHFFLSSLLSIFSFKI